MRLRPSALSAADALAMRAEPGRGCNTGRFIGGYDEILPHRSGAANKS